MLRRTTLISLALLIALARSTTYYSLQGEKWPAETCNGKFPAKEKAIANHAGKKICPGHELIVVNEPRNNPQIRHHTINDKEKTTFYDDNRKSIVHIAECFSDFALPAPKIEAIVKLKNGTELPPQTFDIDKCLAKAQGSFLSFSAGLGLDFEHNGDGSNSDSGPAAGAGLDNGLDNNFNENCPTDFDYMNQDNTDWVKKSTGIWYHSLDKTFDQAEIRCRSTFYKNFTAGSVPVKESTISRPISIRVSHPPEEVRMRIVQDAKSGIIEELECVHFGGYPAIDSGNFKYIVGDATKTKEELLNTILPENTPIQCIGTWSGGHKPLDKKSTIHMSTYISNPNKGSVKDNNLVDGSNEATTGGEENTNKMLGLIIGFCATFVALGLVFLVIWLRKRNKENNDKLPSISDQEENPLKDDSGIEKTRDVM